MLCLVFSNIFFDINFNFTLFTILVMLYDFSLVKVKKNKKKGGKGGGGGGGGAQTTMVLTKTCVNFVDREFFIGLAAWGGGTRGLIISLC
jgi:hypothetical protein